MIHVPTGQWVAFLKAKRHLHQEAVLELGYALSKQLTWANELSGDYGALRLSQKMVDKINQALRPMLQSQMTKHDREIKKIDAQLAGPGTSPEGQ